MIRSLDWTEGGEPAEAERHYESMGLPRQDYLKIIATTVPLGLHTILCVYLLVQP